MSKDDKDVDEMIRDLREARRAWLEAREREELQRLSEPKLTIRQLQRDLGVWQRRNFPNATKLEPVVGVAEELGEAFDAVLQLISFGKLGALVGRVCHAGLKSEQGIRGTPEELRAKLEDAIGDLFIFLVNLCNLFELDLQAIVNDTWLTVSKRNWREDPIAGGGADVL